ncbi:UNVERIFIED_CONTAM: hypothetical protein HDU68_002408, partial [Siphonaria sp. JEL0065]
MSKLGSDLPVYSKDGKAARSLNGSSFFSSFAKRLRRILPYLILVLVALQIISITWNKTHPSDVVIAKPETSASPQGVKLHQQSATVPQIIPQVSPQTSQKAVQKNLPAVAPGAAVVPAKLDAPTTLANVDVNSPYYKYTNKPRFAYTFYGSDDKYACSMLVAIVKLLETNPDPSIDIVFLHMGTVSQAMVDSFHALGTSGGRNNKNKFRDVKINFD